MSDTQTPTPRTDASDLYDYQTAVETCRQLERDLAAASAATDQIKRRIFGEHYEANRNEDAVAAVAHVMQQLDASRAECARLRCSLITFGSHKVGCNVYRHGRPCNCGFGDVAYPRAALSAPTEPNIPDETRASRSLQPIVGGTDQEDRPCQGNA